MLKLCMLAFVLFCEKRHSFEPFLCVLIDLDLGEFSCPESLFCVESDFGITSTHVLLQ